VALSKVDVNALADGHRIGPNAITRVADALRVDLAEAEVAGLFDLAGISGHLINPPQQMVDEREVTRLHQVLRDELGVDAALRIARRAGLYTGDYLLARRIPAGIQRLLAWLPARLASRILLGAIRRHAWTFSGSGELHVCSAYPPRLAIAGCCVCQGARAEVPLCGYYASAIERLFRALVHPRAVVTETTCQATGATACTFEVVW
jgi:divinyl protochlorophyllide a 8-vinyl-reductase